jgi:biotin carboxyl carrier protein
MIWQGAAIQSAGAAQSDRPELETPGDGALWATFSAPPTPDDFFRAWLGIQCGLIARATAGLLLVDHAEGQYAVAATWPDGYREIAQLAAAAGPALKQRVSVIHYPPDGVGRPQSACVAHPIEIGDRLSAIVIVEVAAASSADLHNAAQRLRWGTGWLEASLRRQQAEDQEARIRRMAFAMGVLSDAGEQRELYACVVAVANDLVVQFGCSRVSIGIVRGGRARLTAISNSAIFDRKTHLVEAIENAMEEALVQRDTIALPGVSARRQVVLAHRELMRTTAASSIVSAVMTNASRTVGVITLERDSGIAFDAATVYAIEAVAHLTGPLVEMKMERQRLIAGRLVEPVGPLWRALLGRRRPTIKLIAVLIIGLLTYGAFAQGEFKVSGKAVVEGAVQRTATAPFAGFVATAPFRAGDIVAAGQVLATLDNRELTLEMLRLRGEYEQQVVKYNDALGSRDPAAARFAAAQIGASKAQLAEAEDMLERAKITAPFSGVIVSGDLRQKLGSPVEKGEPLFQLAPLDSFRAILQVDERDIAFVSTGQSGQLVLTGFPGHLLHFSVTAVTPVAAAAEGRNFFRVEAEIEDPDVRLRPGMEGVGKISIERRSFLWIWTRRLADWLFVTAWRWTP